MSMLTDFINNTIRNSNNPPSGFSKDKGDYLELSLVKSNHHNIPEVLIRLHSVVDNKKLPSNFEGIRLSNQGPRLVVEIDQPRMTIESERFEIVFNHI